MARVVGFHLLMFLLPFLVYGTYLYVSRRDPFKRGSWDTSYLYWLTVSGLALTIVSFLLVANFTGNAPGGTYVPARMEDGVMIPGHFE